eukprot:TRINITY_DN3220_c0_g1_i2.p1 TRINITY_DN3220_c0_g1~~TRINITY_DN3220_c0_g1_i2.p1  ORF type:complete len:265 (-),score=101.33 TRINITY_DN3220_c0_g1_i2:247-975(-)
MKFLDGRAHKERSQPKFRQKWGLLEKKKDYVQRAKDYHKKERRIKRLKLKAALKNPDEFYFKMEKLETEDGIHKRVVEEKKYTQEELTEMKTQDLGYVITKTNMETNKIEKLQSRLHLLSAKKPNTHTIFIDNEKEAAKFSAAKYFNTDPTLVGRQFNRPKLEQLSDPGFFSHTQTPNTKTPLRVLEKEKEKSYKELTERMERKQKLEKMRDKLIQDKNKLADGKKRKLKPGVVEVKRQRKK